MYCLSFEYDHKGFGGLALYTGGSEDRPEMIYDARSGSLDGKGGFSAKPISTTLEWWVKDNPLLPAISETPAMSIGGIGWKLRLYYKVGPMYFYDGHCIHPDGAKPGTLGCIGIIGTHASIFRDRIIEIRKEQPLIRLYVSQR